MRELPAPLTPPDCDLTGYDWMPLYGHQLLKSDFYLRASDREKLVAQELWWAAWLQVPAASLPDDDIVLAALAGYSQNLKGWAKIKSAVLYNFIKCNDGRLYHKFLANVAIASYEKRLKGDKKREAGRIRLMIWREEQRLKKEMQNGDQSHHEGNLKIDAETCFETPHETRFVAGRQDRTLQDNKKENNNIAQTAAALPLPARASENDFLTFWAIYPRKVGKEDARKAFAKALKKSHFSIICEAVKVQTWPADEQYIPYPASWLRAERWLDEKATHAAIEPPKAPSSGLDGMDAYHFSRWEKAREDNFLFPLRKDGLDKGWSPEQREAELLQEISRISPTAFQAIKSNMQTHSCALSAA